MKSFWQAFHKVGKLLHIPDLPKWLCGILMFILLLRIPTFFEPYYYGDEMVYLTLGQGVRQGLTLYKDIHDNKPPLLYLTAAASESLFWFRAALALFNVISIVIFFKIAEALFAKNSRFQKLATILFALITTLPLLEGGTANAEGFMMLPVLTAFYILLTQNKKPVTLLVSGILFGMAALYKVPAAFELPVILVYWLLTSGFEISKIKEVMRNSFFVVAGFLIPIVISLVWFYLRGDLGDYVKAAFLQNIGYLSSFRPGDVRKPFIVRNAPLIIRALIVIAGVAILAATRKKVSNRFLFMCTWVLFVLFAITLSERPYPHYFLQGIAPVSLLLATLLADKSLEQSLSIIPLTLALFVPFYYKFWLYPVTPYYLRFTKFALGKITKEAYFNSFNSHTTRNYEVASFLATSSTSADRIFVWDPDSPTIYALARRLPPIKYIVPYHVNDYSNKAEMAKLLVKSPPKFIVLTAGNSYPEINSLVSSHYLLIQQIEDANIYVFMLQSGKDGGRKI